MFALFVIATTCGTSYGAESTVQEGSRAGEAMMLTIKDVEVNFRWIPAGEFVMGSPENEEDRFPDPYERRHDVTLTRGFWMAEGLTTQELWVAFMDENPSKFQESDQLPVETVSWEECQDFLSKVNAAESDRVSGFHFALPTEAQWEYACRAGTTTPFNFGTANNGEQANCDGRIGYGTDVAGKYIKTTTVAGSYPANAWGLYDMHGNVYEWCADWFDAEYYETSPKCDPTGPDHGKDRVIRGGAWYGYPEDCRSANRCFYPPTARYNNIGFRMILIRD